MTPIQSGSDGAWAKGRSGSRGVVGMGLTACPGGATGGGASGAVVSATCGPAAAAAPPTAGNASCAGGCSGAGVPATVGGGRISRISAGGRLCSLLLDPQADRSAAPRIRAAAAASLNMMWLGIRKEAAMILDSPVAGERRSSPAPLPPAGKTHMTRLRHESPPMNRAGCTPR